MPTPEVMHQAICEILGEAFSLEALTSFIERLYRRKKILYLTRSLPVGMTGCCIPFADVDVICIQRGLNPILERIVRLHELSHLLLGHLPKELKGRTAYVAFLEDPQRALQVALHRDHSTAYDEPQEFEAETLATLLFKNITDDGSTSPLARELYDE